LPVNEDLVHRGILGATAAPSQHAFDFFPVPFEDRRHPAIREIAHPTGEASGYGLITGMSPEKYALHPAADEHLGSRQVRHVPLPAGYAKIFSISQDIDKLPIFAAN
jgi:hypothetical protein